MSDYDPTTDPVREFADALPPAVRHQLNHTARLTALIHRAVRDQGWTVPELIARCTRDLGSNPGGVITFRLENCADNPPRTQTGHVRLPFCSPECRDNAGWIVNEDGLPIDRCKCRMPGLVVA